MVTRLYILGIVAMLAGCASPIEPSRVAPVTVLAAEIDPRLTAVVAALDAVATPLPWNGLTFREWRTALNVPIRVEPMDHLYGAVWTGTAIVFNDYLPYYDTAGKAGLLAHELRHVDGIGHDCGPHQDKRATEWSAYAVHVWTLTVLGEHQQAKNVEGGFCDEP